MSTVSPKVVRTLPFLDRMIWNVKFGVGLALLAGAVWIGRVSTHHVGPAPVPMQSGVVPVSCNCSISSGVRVGEEIVLSSHHGTKSGSVVVASLPATVIASDPSVDLVLIKVPGLKCDSVPIAGPKDDVTGSAVFYGFPQGYGFRATRTDVDEKGKLTQDAIGGNSGGPLMKNGKLIGIVLTTRGVATAGQIRAFVAKTHPWLVPN